MNLIISFAQTSKLADQYRLRLWIYVRDSPLIYRVSRFYLEADRRSSVSKIS